MNYKIKFTLIDKSIIFFEDWLMVILFSLASLLGVYQVILRYVFSMGNDWVEAYMITLVVYAALIAASVAVRRKVHVELDVVVKLFPLKTQWYIMLCSYSLCLLYVFALWIFGLMFVNQVILYDDVNILSDLPEWIHYLCVPIGMGLMSIRYAQELVILFKKGPMTTDKVRKS